MSSENQPDHIYKICACAEWREAQAAGAYRGSADDAHDGFIHLSTADQLPGTARKHFAGKPNLIVIAFASADLGPDLKWEPSRGGQLFPHFYADLPPKHARAIWPLPLNHDGIPQLPNDLVPPRTTAAASRRTRPAPPAIFRSMAEALSLPALHAFDAETAHTLTLKAIKSGMAPIAQGSLDAACLTAGCLGKNLANPIGLAAGFDKDGEVPDAMLAAGFGYVEVGTVTPRAQPGNPRPRAFRLSDAQAVLNRYGFNNAGHDALAARLRHRTDTSGLGINIGANKDATDRIADYAAGVERFAGNAHYLTVNISSPNTPGLRDLQAPEQLRTLLTNVMQIRDDLATQGAPTTPVVVKLAPDISETDLPAIIETLTASRVDAIAVSNTTLSRAALASRARHAHEAGGLSGAPLFARSTIMLARVYQLTGGTVPLIGIGGIDSGARAVEKIKAGASLIQLYTGLVFKGLALLDEIKSAIVRATHEAGACHYSELIGQNAKAWAARDISKT